MNIIIAIKPSRVPVANQVGFLWLTKWSTRQTKWCSTLQRSSENSVCWHGPAVPCKVSGLPTLETPYWFGSMGTHSNQLLQHLEDLSRCCSLGLTLRLRDTKWSVICTPNAITHSAQSHLTAATMDGAQIERHLIYVHSKKEQVTLYKQSFMGRQNFEPKSDCPSN